MRKDRIRQGEQRIEAMLGEIDFPHIVETEIVGRRQEGASVSAVSGEWKPKLFRIADSNVDFPKCRFSSSRVWSPAL
jgi:hypothetical protein